MSNKDQGFALNADWIQETVDGLRQMADMLASMKPVQMGRTPNGKPDGPSLRLAFADQAPIAELTKQGGWQGLTTGLEQSAYIKIGPLFVWATAPKGTQVECEHCGTTHNCVHGDEVQA